MSKAQKCRRYKADETDLPQQPSGCEDKKTTTVKAFESRDFKEHKSPSTGVTFR